jgi:hypothetical protein
MPDLPRCRMCGSLAPPPDRSGSTNVEQPPGRQEPASERREVQRPNPPVPQRRTPPKEGACNALSAADTLLGILFRREEPSRHPYPPPPLSPRLPFVPHINTSRIGRLPAGHHVISSISVNDHRAGISLLPPYSPSIGGYVVVDIRANGASRMILPA